MTSRRTDLLTRIILTVAALVPYWKFLTFSVVMVTDDIFASDIFNGELPGRVIAGQMLRRGEWPTWTSQICSGVPLAGFPMDPISVLTFATLPTAPALDLFIVLVILVAAHGAFGLARRLGADRIGALLAGIAFSGCGFFAAQLKHLAIVSTVAWFPWGLLLLDRAFGREDGDRRAARRSLNLALFGLVFAVQALCGFPQSAYICALVYGAFALCRAVEHRASMTGPYAWMGWLAVAAAAITLGAAGGAAVLLPLAKLGEVSDRSSSLGWEWATHFAYWPKDAWMFLFPYFNGDISDLTFRGPAIFWEDYSYLGLLTFILAIAGAIRDWRRTTTKLVVVLTLLAFALVLGRATPVYHVAFLLIPGLSTFRFPTRFLFVVELGIALLAAIGLTRLRSDLRARVRPRFSDGLAAVVVVVTVIDLLIYQPRQNAVVPAATWLAPPASVALIKTGAEPPRTFTPQHREMHMQAFANAFGWLDVEPYDEARDLLEPNVGGGYWNVASADCYAGISARWYVDVWGDHNRPNSIAALLLALSPRDQQLLVHDRLPNFLRTYGVTHVLSPFPQRGTLLPFVGRAGGAYIYGVPDAQRVRFVSAARVVPDDRRAAAVLLAADFDPSRLVVLHDAPASAATDHAVVAGGRASIAREAQREIDVNVTAPADGFLLVADTYYPGWTASVDGRSAPLYRADVSLRSVPVPAGTHAVRLRYEGPGLSRGTQATAAALSLLLAWTAAAIVAVSRRARRSTAGTGST